jgi:archaellum biogenesis protein FlaJ (TadC family)
MHFIGIFVSIMVVMLTAANAFAPYAAAGGHRFKIFLYGSIMLAISGAVMIVVPAVVQGLFSSVASAP